MDLTFTLSPRDSERTPKWAATLEDIKAAAEERRSTNARCTVAGYLRGQEGEAETVHILARSIVPERGGPADMILLGGSFNPAVARRLMVGKQGEDGVYLRALADVQG